MVFACFVTYVCDMSGHLQGWMLDATRRHFNNDTLIKSSLLCIVEQNNGVLCPSQSSFTYIEALSVGCC